MLRSQTDTIESENLEHKTWLLVTLKVLLSGCQLVWLMEYEKSSPTLQGYCSCPPPGPCPLIVAAFRARSNVGRPVAAREVMGAVAAGQTGLLAAGIYLHKWILLLDFMFLVVGSPNDSRYIYID
jgi:hypothetical protein